MKREDLEIVYFLLSDHVSFQLKMLFVCVVYWLIFCFKFLRLLANVSRSMARILEQKDKIRAFNRIRVG